MGMHGSGCASRFSCSRSATRRKRRMPDVPTSGARPGWWFDWGCVPRGRPPRIVQIRLTHNEPHPVVGAAIWPEALLLVRMIESIRHKRPQRTSYLRIPSDGRANQSSKNPLIDSINHARAYRDGGGRPFACVSVVVVVAIATLEQRQRQNKSPWWWWWGQLTRWSSGSGSGKTK